MKTFELVSRSKSKYQQPRKWPGRASESVSSSVGSNLNYRMGGQGASTAGGGSGGGPHDLTKVLLTDDYFSDANPRSMRRLMNVLYVMGRLLKAFQVRWLNSISKHDCSYAKVAPPPLKRNSN